MDYTVLHPCTAQSAHEQTSYWPNLQKLVHGTCAHKDVATACSFARVKQVNIEP
jgi:hypothetical protein